MKAAGLTSSSRYSYRWIEFTQMQGSRRFNPSFVVEKEGGNRDSAMQGLRKTKAKRQRTHKTIDIPDDIWEEVLLRLPVKSLLRLKSVCKSWRDTIGSRRFKRCQLLISRARRPTMLILPLQDMTPPMRMDEIRFFAYPGHGTTAELLHERLSSIRIGEEPPSA
ncbi:hypothetical protein EJB05_22572, partial [Eragrostis curvula]